MGKKKKLLKDKGSFKNELITGGVGGALEKMTFDDRGGGGKGVDDLIKKLL